MGLPQLWQSHRAKSFWFMEGTSGYPDAFVDKWNRSGWGKLELQARFPAALAGKYGIPARV